MGSGPGSKVELYKDQAGEWRWRAIAANGKIVADSGEGYSSLGDAFKGAQAAEAALEGSEPERADD